MKKEFRDSYCYKALYELSDEHKQYHAQDYGVPIDSDQELFTRLMLEVNQAGLSWDVVLKKKDGLVEAYDFFDIQTVANYGEEDRERLKNDPRVIRNKLKINAAIHNAQQILEIQKEFGSFRKWLDNQGLKTRDEWVKIFKKKFKFTGGEITNEFLMSTGHLEGAHHPECPLYEDVLQSGPLWYVESE